MKHTILFLLIGIFIDKIHLIKINVIGNLTEENDFGCNTQVILQCIVAPNTNLLFWQVGDPITPTTATAAECSKSNCSVNPDVSNFYSFSYDETSGESNMTIKNVTLMDNGKQYKCDVVSTFVIFDSVVQVPPEKPTTQITSMNVSGTTPGTTQIIISTGCVTPRIEDLVTFNWFIIDMGGKTESYEEAMLETSRDESPCQISSDCIANGSAALSNKCTVEEDSDAPEVYFLVKILLRNRELFTVKTSSTFRPKSLISTAPSSTPNNWNITISTVKIATTTASLNTVSDGSTNSSECCDTKEIVIVITVAWASTITLTIVGSCILNYSLNKMDVYKCIFQLATLPWIFLFGTVVLYRGEKKWGLVLVLILISFVLDAAFIGMDIYYVCFRENICVIELVDHLWASLIYLAVSVVLSVSKYIILEKCCESDSTVPKSNSDLNQTDVRHKHGPLGARPLPRIASVSSRLGNEREQEHSLKHVQLMQRSPLPPISTKGHAKTGT